MAKLLGKLIGTIINIVMIPIVLILAIPMGILKARRSQKARLLFTGAEQTLLGKAQRAINMEENGLISPDRDLLEVAKCIENARCDYQIIKGRERFDSTFFDFVLPRINSCYVQDWDNVINFFELSNYAQFNEVESSTKKNSVLNEPLEWVHDLWHWADEHDIEKYNIPREKNELLNLKHLSFESISYFEREKFHLLPKEIGNLRNLIFLELGNVVHPEILLNNLIEIPKEIGNLTELTHLYLQFNSLSELPAEIGNLTKLKELKLGGNDISYLPKEIGKLKELEILTIWNNNLKELPREIGLLTNLKGFDISGNSLTYLPDEITNLTALKSFYYSDNDLQLSESQKSWIVMLKNNGCEVYPEEIEDELFDDDIPF
ncbi:leucine-rich repeat domain-containing protein [Shewanella ulleungensis]|uniref:leucine-rich repeat domain-containing protein n=1 Tax=Shewanella ulleungensis TaxID=2282699 RepID=UPI003D7B07C8